MRVISGTRKGHGLKAPKGSKVRPTEDRIKESLFDILGNINKDSIVLDAFAGSGSIGIEFLSRGAKKAYFVDNYYESISIIKENLKHTKLIDKAEIIKSDIFMVLKNFNKRNIVFDYIYIDPPFKKEGLVPQFLENLYNQNILSDTGIIIIEHERELILKNRIHYFEKKDYREYGNKSLTFYKINEKGDI